MDEIIGAGVASGTAVGVSADSFIGFSDGGLLIALGADMGNNIATGMCNRLTSDTNTSPDMIIYFGDPISVFDMNAKTVFPSFKQRWNNSAHSYYGLFIKDAVPVHDVENNPLRTSPDYREAEVITY